MFIFIFIIFGLIIGSFLNVCIHRLPEKKSIVYPSSNCPNCRAKIKWYDNLPVLSFIILKAKCRHCKNKISLRYPAVEILTALLTAVFAAKLGVTLWCFTALIAVYTLIVLSFIDLKYFIIPDELSLGLIALGLITSFLNPNFNGTILIKLSQSFIGALCGFALVYAIALIGEKILKKEAMGGGDIKLLAGVGALVGWQGAVSTIVMGSFFGAIYGIFLLIGKKIKKRDPIPFGPFLSMAAVINLYQTISFFDFFVV